MFKLRYGYLISGIITGCILLFSYIGSIPDGKLHIVFCNVGQGDGAYIRLPDGRDMVVDGGPNNQILDCLSRHMPFWDRRIDIVMMTHPQKDHAHGLVEVVRRYTVGYLVRSDVANTTESYQTLQAAIAEQKVPVKFITRGDQIAIDQTTFTFLWPSEEQISKGKSVSGPIASADEKVLGTSIGDLNDYALVFHLRYGTFDALFTADADSRVQSGYVGYPLKDKLEVLKVPHHGSRTGMTEAFVAWLRPQISVISSGKNNYGHPSVEAIQLLESVGSIIHRTDKEGDVEVISDGDNWIVKQEKQREQ